jgi:hypothetical protein
VTDSPRRYMPAVLAFPLAAFFGVSSFAGIVFPDIVYRREAPLWAAQGIGQDWVDLLLVSPLLVWSGWLTLRGSRAARPLLGGTIVYALYSLVLYTFAMHFNPLFLVYCGGLGFAFYALAGLLANWSDERRAAAYGEHSPVRSTGAFVALLGIAFYALWLSEVVPALAAGTPPASLSEVGLITNPVHVLDLSIVLPAFVIAGVALYRRSPLGYVLAPIMLSFGVVMDVALAAMVWSMSRRALAGGGPPIGVFLGIALVSGAVLWRFLRSATRQPAPRS